MTYWSIWWRTFAWIAAIAGAIALVVLLVHVVPVAAWLWVGIAALGLLAVSYIAGLIWIDKGNHK